MNIVIVLGESNKENDNCYLYRTLESRSRLNKQQSRDEKNMIYEQHSQFDL